MIGKLATLWVCLAMGCSAAGDGTDFETCDSCDDETRGDMVTRTGGTGGDLTEAGQELAMYFRAGLHEESVPVKVVARVRIPNPEFDLDLSPLNDSFPELRISDLAGSAVQTFSLLAEDARIVAEHYVWTIETSVVPEATEVRLTNPDDLYRRVELTAYWSESASLTYSMGSITKITSPGGFAHIEFACPAEGCQTNILVSAEFEDEQDSAAPALFYWLERTDVEWKPDAELIKESITVSARDASESLANHSIFLPQGDYTLATSNLIDGTAPEVMLAMEAGADDTADR